MLKKIRRGNDYVHYDDEELWRLFVRAFLVGFILAAVTAGVQYLTAGKYERPLFKLLSNSFLVPAVILIGAGLMSWVNTFGFFDVPAVGMRQLGASITGRFDHPDGRRKTFDVYEYRKEQVVNRKRRTRWYRVVVGLVFLLFSILFAYLSIKYEF